MYLRRWDDSWVTTNSQDEDWDKKGDGTGMFNFFPSFSLFAILLFLRVSFWFPGIMSGLSLCLILFLFFCFLWCHSYFRKMLIHYHSSWSSRQSYKNKRRRKSGSA